jgi:putative transposase
VAFDGQHVTFRWRDYAHGNRQREMTVSAEEFIRRFLLHVLPRGFVRISQLRLSSKPASCHSAASLSSATPNNGADLAASQGN